MKVFLCNLTWGRRSIGDEAILAGLLTNYDKHDVIVGSYTPAETESIYNVKAVNEQELVDVDTLVVGGGLVLPTSLRGLNELVDRYKRSNCRIEVRAIQVMFGKIEEYLSFLEKADYVSVRCKHDFNILQYFVDVKYERDFAFNCPSQKFEHAYHGWIGYNAVDTAWGGQFIEPKVYFPLPEGKLLGIAGVKHRCDSREDDFVAIKRRRCDSYFDTVNPMKMRYLLSTLKCLYSQRKHLALLAHLSDTPAYYFGSAKENRTVVEEWGIPILG